MSAALGGGVNANTFSLRMVVEVPLHTATLADGTPASLSCYAAAVWGGLNPQDLQFANSYLLANSYTPFCKVHCVGIAQTIQTS